jgi:hypothetical protein
MISFRNSDIGGTMIRTIISLSTDDKAWLDRKAREERVPMTRLVRRAIQRLRKETDAKPTRFEALLRSTAGIRKSGDGLAAQRRLRNEWTRRR